ncbi:MAG: DUF4837 family protein [Bacteroidales bacterium]|nr:DUF4837 family protein [Bacteroidales bacterium]MDD4436246.1 DUF4837 family protein [Bacteroidales bacterium]MDD5733289.1 DUF4837 family protein [Bacteroidales bacterium]
MRIKTLLITGCIAVMATACTNGPQLKQNVSGKAGEILVVMNKNIWESGPGQSLRAILAVDFPFLPQQEPLFSLFNINENAFSTIFQVHRNIIICNTNHELAEAKMVIQKDIWAAPQIVVTLSGPDMESIQECIDGNSDLLLNAMEQAERNRVIQNSKKYEEKNIRDYVTKMMGGSPYFPTGYRIKKRTDNFTWIAYETTYTTQGIFIYTYPYRSEDDLTLSRIIAERNLKLEKEVPGPLDNTYMTTNSLIEPSYRWVNYNNRQFVEIRGLWDVKNDFMGGPFVAHCFYDKASQSVVVLEAFVYAPKYPKRNYLRQVESIIYSFEWQNE